MMSFGRRMLAVVALGLLAVGAPGSARQLSSVDATCSAFSFLEIYVTGGKCSGIARADCTAVAESNSDYQEAFNEWFSEGGVCDSGKAEAAAWAVADAIALVWANAFTKVKCHGQGFACGWSVANGDAWAIAFAEAVAQAAADAGAGTDATGFCYADIRALATVVADVAAKAQADVCTTGGTKKDFQNSYAASIQTAIADAFAKATASACSDDGLAYASSECTGTAVSDSSGDVVEEGDATAMGGQVKQCKGELKRKCCDNSHKSRVCLCEGCNGAWRRATDYDEPNFVKRSWTDKTGDKCFC